MDNNEDFDRELIDEAKTDLYDALENMPLNELSNVEIELYLLLQHEKEIK